MDFKSLKYSLKEATEKNIVKELSNQYNDFILFGSYPRIALENDNSKKEIILKQIISTYVKKDLIDLVKIKDLSKYNKLLRILSDTISSLLNVSELSNTIGISRSTINNYLFLMEQTYIIKMVTPFYNNIRSELSKTPKLYFEDTGLANVLQYGFLNQKMSGSLFENSIYSELRKIKNIFQINYWRTKSKQEIDFIVQSKKGIFPIEIKLNFNNQSIYPLINFMNINKLQHGYICTLNKNIEIIKDKRIKVIYPWQLRYIF